MSEDMIVGFCFGLVFTAMAARLWIPALVDYEIEKQIKEKKGKP